jgi:hypothetical protein
VLAESHNPFIVRIGIFVRSLFSLTSPGNNILENKLFHILTNNHDEKYLKSVYTKT